MDPEWRVRELVKSYANMERVSPIISSFTRHSQHAAIFECSLEQKLKLSQSRSARLDKNSARDEKSASRSFGKHYSQDKEEKLFLSPGIVAESPEEQHFPALPRTEDCYVKYDSFDHSTVPPKTFRVAAESFEDERCPALSKTEDCRLEHDSFKCTTLPSIPFLKDKHRPPHSKIKDCHVQHDGFDRTTLLPQPFRLASASKAEADHMKLDSPKRITLAPRLWRVYEEAREDFRSCSTDNHDRTEAAKFLRDTVENAIHCIKSK
ncbi:hypothetical protein MMC07_004976 [Pseudocyphellaria aurata]|nr:hypothetical protein [Pseudocyphellaria aurata]